MSKRKEIILAIVGMVIVAIIILFIWAIQNKKITPFAGTVHSASLSISPAVGVLQLNQEFIAEILVDAQDLQSSGIELLINYDSAKIEIIDQDSAKEGIQIAASGLFPIVFENIVDESSGTIRFSTSKGKDDSIFINSPRVLAEINLKPTGVVDSTQLNFDFTKGKTSDCNVFQYSNGLEQDVLFGVNNGYYQILE